MRSTELPRSETLPIRRPGRDWVASTGIELGTHGMTGGAEHNSAFRRLGVAKASNLWLQSDENIRIAESHIVLVLNHF